LTPAHELVNPEGLSEPAGYTHVVVPAPGRLVHVAGQIASDAGGTCRGDTIAEQLELALQNVATALRAVEGAPEHVVSMQIYTTDMEAYRAERRQIGEGYRAVFGRHYPAISLFQVSNMYDPAAVVEVVCTAVIP
jgi:enamine deaminase RidA (YjgF/YER057c/UK114 family)